MQALITLHYQFILVSVSSRKLHAHVSRVGGGGATEAGKGRLCRWSTFDLAVEGGGGGS